MQNQSQSLQNEVQIMLILLNFLIGKQLIDIAYYRVYTHDANSMEKSLCYKTYLDRNQFCHDCMYKPLQQYFDLMEFRQISPISVAGEIILVHTTWNDVTSYVRY